MKKIYWVLFIIFIILGVGYFKYIKTNSSPIKTKEVINKSHIKVGVITPLTGIVASFGEESKRGIEAAKLKLRTQMPDTEIEIVYEDDKCDPKVALSAFKKLTALDGVKIIIGPMCGSPQEVLAPIAFDSGVILLLPSAASSYLYDISKGNVYNMQYSLELESAFNANYMYEAGIKRVATISYPNAFSQTHLKSFTQNYKGEIVKNISLQADSKTLDTEILKLKKEKIDAIYITDISFYFANGVEKLKLAKINTPLYSNYAVELPMVRALVGTTTYSFPSGITDGQGGVYSLYENSLITIAPMINPCKSDIICIKSKLDTSGIFDDKGIAKRNIDVKQIINGEPVYIKQ